MNQWIKLPVRKYVIVGSYALGTRWAKDIDIVCLEKDILCDWVRKDDYSGHFYHIGKRIEVLLADKQESLREILDEHGCCDTAEIWELYALKRGSIMFQKRFFDKHIADLHVLYNMLYEHDPYPGNLIKLHQKCTEERIGKQKLPKLIGVTKDEFFDDKVVKYREHDIYHYCMAHKDRPMYSYMQEKEGLVECSKTLWNKFNQQEKIWTVLEEAYSIALEREIIPTEMGDKLGKSHFEAFKWALYRICTTLCSGWFRDFAIDNYFAILNSYELDYVEKFHKNISKYEKELSSNSCT